MKIQNTALFFLCALLMLGVSCNKTDKNPQTAPYILASPSSYSMVTGEKKQLDIETFPHVAVSALQISSDNTAVAQVNGTGLITAVGVGEATINITAPSAALSASCKVSVLEVTDLSNTGKGPANCYIITKPGAYKFKAVKGNTNYSVGETVDTAVVLWKSFNTFSIPGEKDIIDHVFSNGNEIVVVTQTNKFENGNALVAAEDSEGTILWSWHLWFVEDYKVFDSAVACKNSVGSVMDRNLGATEAALSNYYGTYGPFETYGLIYQWGRKDPFLGSKGAVSGELSTGVKTYYQVASTMRTNWPDAQPSTAACGTIAWATEHPTTWLCAGGGSANESNWLHIANMSLWSSAKTQYDPCPPGWKVPTGGLGGFFATAAGGKTVDIDSGWCEGGYNVASYLAQSSLKLYFPYNGKKYGGSAMYLYQVGKEKGSGSWWTVSDDGNGVIYTVVLQSVDNEGHASKLDLRGYENNLATGIAVRCVTE